MAHADLTSLLEEIYQSLRPFAHSGPQQAGSREDLEKQLYQMAYAMQQADLTILRMEKALTELAWLCRVERSYRKLSDPGDELEKTRAKISRILDSEFISGFLLQD